MSIMVILFFAAAAVQGWQVFRIRSDLPWNRNRGAHFAGAHGLMLFAMALAAAGLADHNGLWFISFMVLSAAAPLAWGAIDLAGKLRGKG